MKHYTDFKHHHRTYEAIGLTWEEVEEILGHKHTGTPEDDEEIIGYLVDHTEYSRDWLGEGATDEDGYYVLIGPFWRAGRK